MAISVRFAKTEDDEAVGCVSGEAFAGVRRLYSPNPTARAHLSTIAPRLERLVAEDGAQIVGTLRFGRFDGCMRIIGLAVLPRFQRRGVARALIEEVARLAWDRGCSTLTLYTVTKTGNVAIFNRLGFQVIAEQPDEYSISADGEALTEAYMERALRREP
jgi:ribosomal protein S18 acetylase RimI-like enzyme